MRRRGIVERVKGIDGLLFLATRPVSQDEFLAAIKRAAEGLGIIPQTVEIIADGYSSSLGEARNSVISDRSGVR
jgi:hypothetical protein